jgi:hypothetical protein
VLVEPRPEPPETDRLWRVDDYARYVDVPVASVYYRIKLGQIPILRLGKSIRIDPAQAIAALKTGGAA